MKLEGTAALVTGGESGPGAATVRALANAGARVGVLDINAESGQAIAEEAGGTFALCDVANEASARAAIDACGLAHGPARTLVNCAGIGTAARIVGRQGPMDLEAFARVIQINLIGTFNMMQLAAEPMMRVEADENGERGVIVSTASVAAYEGQIGQAAYAASKGGIVSLTLPAAREFARWGIQVTAIAPGLFKTPLLGELPDDLQQILAETIPHPARLGEPAEFANLVLAILTNPYLDGETIRLDGALRMAPR